ncbi:xylosyl- and glucuronyltransferase LARGE2s isoform X1 [Lepeophtheirus salmonis]|uniref:xylosyl- and glucuronyltransferase LARGE2s isoform X1 n=1 Tax=Lepeophtheirus salmonis TaxID=72036 RepID=UPI001AE26F12|nr:LARGE xylosyl- and glucuronyltransferase 2-like isoform X1 [Lepeophtheirus salmonis]
MGRGRKWFWFRYAHLSLFVLILLIIVFIHFKSKWVQLQLFNDPNNPLGLNGREARLADRVRDMEDQNQILRRQLSISQSQLISAMSQKRFPTSQEPPEEDEEYHHHSNKPCDDFVPKCDVLHIGIVCAGYNSSRSVVTLIKSILFYRKHPLHFHFITDPSTKRVLDTLFQTWKILQVKVSFYEEDVSNEVNWVPNKHYSGIYGLLKLTLPKVLSNVSKIIVLDTDVTLATDISKLWKYFSNFEVDQCLGLVENQSDWYIPGKLWKNHRPWPALGRGFNTGVILMDLNKLRSFQWNTKWKLIAEKDLTTLYVTALADQDIFNAVLKSYPQLLYKLPCNWNVQLSDNSRSSEFCYSLEVQDLNIIHFNSPKKLRVQNPHVEFFRNHFLTFIQYDGNLLRRDLIGCNVTTAKSVSNMESKGSDQSCYEFYLAGKTVYRTHIYFLDYLLPQSKDSLVTLVAQLSIDRLHMIENLCTQWSGPMSLALYLSDAEAQEFFTFASNSEILKRRKNIGYHVVYKEGSFYPVNYLRNVALNEVETDYVFLSDIDFLPGVETYSSLCNVIRNSKEHAKVTRAYVIPAFETQRYRLPKFPKNKAQVIDLLDEGTLLTFRYHIWMKGHSATDYGKWRTATSPYKIQWAEDFEPYIVVHKDLVPKYDTRFVGFGWNKVSYILELFASGFDFIVLPNVFMVHMPHAPSLDIARFRSSSSYRRCLNDLKKKFVKEINLKYGTSLKST